MDLRLSMRQVAEGVVAHGPELAERPATDAAAPETGCALRAAGHELATTPVTFARSSRALLSAALADRFAPIQRTPRRAGRSHELSDPEAP